MLHLHAYHQIRIAEHIQQVPCGFYTKKLQSVYNRKQHMTHRACASNATCVIGTVIWKLYDAVSLKHGIISCSRFLGIVN